MALALLLHLLTAFITFETHVRQLLTAFIAFETHVRQLLTAFTAFQPQALLSTPGPAILLVQAVHFVTKVTLFGAQLDADLLGCFQAGGGGNALGPGTTDRSMLDLFDGLHFRGPVALSHT
jgi:hypothetical protein